MYITQVIMYSKDDCPWCDKARDLLNKHHIDFKELKLGRDYTKADLVMKHHCRNVKITVPQIWSIGFGNNEIYIGGYEDLAKELDIPSEK